MFISRHGQGQIAHPAGVTVCAPQLPVIAFAISLRLLEGDTGKHLIHQVNQPGVGSGRVDPLLRMFFINTTQEQINNAAKVALIVVISNAMAQITVQRQGYKADIADHSGVPALPLP